MNARHTLVADIEQFLFHEARLLDEQRFDEWVALFDEDGEYWVPAELGHASASRSLSVFYEDKALLKLRARRLSQPDLHAQVPPARAHHHIGGVTAERRGEYVEASSTLILAEYRLDSERWFSGRNLHRLRETSAGFRIVLKRVDLLNCDAPHRALSIPF